MSDLKDKMHKIQLRPGRAHSAMCLWVCVCGCGVVFSSVCLWLCVCLWYCFQLCLFVGVCVCVWYCFQYCLFVGVCVVLDVSWGCFSLPLAPFWFAGAVFDLHWGRFGDGPFWSVAIVGLFSVLAASLTVNYCMHS